MAELREDPITEGYFDRHVHRPIAARIVGRVPRLPDAARLAGAGLVVGLTGVAAILLGAPHGLDWVFPAWMLFAFTIAGRCSRLVAPARAGAGVVLDLAVGLAFWVALTLRTAPATLSTWLLAGVTLLAALFQAGLHGQLRARFVAFTGPRDAPPPDEPLTTLRLVHDLGAGLAHDLAEGVLGPEHTGPRPPPGPARSILAGPMRMAALLGHDTHLALLYGATALAALRPDLSFGTVVLAVVVGLDLWALMVVSAWRRAETLVRELALA